MSRYYYDVFRLMQPPTGEAAQANDSLASIAHATRGYSLTDPDFDLDAAVNSRLSLAPSAPMLESLRRDYDAMIGMIMGPAPAFDAIIGEVVRL